MSSVLFATSGVETCLWLPPLAAFVSSFFGSMVGISGAFLLLPFQMSLLGYVGPSVIATNLVFNLYASARSYDLPADGAVARRYELSSAAPDWALGSLFRLGGVIGMYLGAATQRHASQHVLRVGLGLVLAALSGSYLASPLI